MEKLLYKIREYIYVLLVGLGIVLVILMFTLNNYSESESKKSIDNARNAQKEAMQSFNNMRNESNISLIDTEINLLVSVADFWLIHNSTDGLFTDISVNAIHLLGNGLTVNDKGELLSKIAPVRYVITSKPGDAKHYILKVYGLNSVNGALAYIQNSQLSKAKEIILDLDRDSLNLDFTNEIAIDLLRKQNKFK